MAKKKETTEKEEEKIALPARLEDLDIDQVPLLIKQFDDAIGKLSLGEQEKEIQNVEIPEFGVISEIKTVEECVKAVGIIRSSQKFYNTSKNEILDIAFTEKEREVVEIADYKVDGKHDVEKVIHAIAARVRIIKNEKSLAALKAGKEKLQKYISKKQQFQQDMQDVFSIFKEARSL